MLKKNDKFVRFQEKQEIFTVKETTRVRLPEGKSFNLLPGMKFVVLKEQTAESQTLSEKIISAFDEALKDSVVKVKVVADESKDVDGTKVTDITFEAYIDDPDAEDEEMLTMVEFEFTPEFDKVISDILIEKFEFERVESDEINRFWVQRVEETEEKVEEEKEEETEYIEPILSGGPEVEESVVMQESEESDAKIEDKIEKLEDEKKEESDKDEKKEIQKEIDKLEDKLDKDDDTEEMKESEEKTEEELKKELEEKKDELKDAEDKKEKEEIKDEIAEIKDDLKDMKESIKPVTFKRAPMSDGWL